MWWQMISIFVFKKRFFGESLVLPFLGARGKKRGKRKQRLKVPKSPYYQKVPPFHPLLLYYSTVQHRTKRAPYVKRKGE